MTINIFLAIFASVLFLTGVIGCKISYSINEEGLFVTGVIFTIFSIISFILAFILSSNYEILLYDWLIFICPLTYIFLISWAFFTKEYIFPWNRSYYEEYKVIKSNFDTLWKKYNELQKDFENLKQSHQKEIEKILNKQSIEINKNNSKLYF